MKTKRIFACLLASLMICGASTACSSKDASSDSSSESSSEASESSESSEEESSTADESSEESSKTPVAVDTADFEEAVAAESGDAYLAIVDGQWWVQYWGGIDDDGSMLAYDAGVVPITGDGDYTVSVTADTNGFRYDTTGDASGSYTPGGLEFMSVMVKDGETLFPGAIITVNSVKVDGADLALTSKAYTSSDDGIETRANIYNAWCNGIPSSDARTADGNLYVDFDTNSPTAACADYAPIIVNKEDFSEWTTVEVNFTITGTGAEGGQVDDTTEDTTEAAAE